MSDILFAFQTVFPLLVYMLIGIIVRKTQLADEESLGQVNNLVFKIFIPMSIFKNIVGAEMGTVNMGPVLLYAVFGVSGIFLLAWGFFAATEPDRQQRSVMIQNAFRSNFVLFGLPLTQMILSGKGSGVTEVLIAVIVPVFNVLAVFILQFYGEGKMNIKKLLIGVFTNPLIVSAIIALLYKSLVGSMPVSLEKPVSGMAAAATPIALIILGARFQFEQSRVYKKNLIIGVLSRLIIVPLIFIGGALALGFRGEVVVAFLAISASPVAVASYSMSQGMGADYKLAGQLLVYDSLFCSVTLFAFIYGLRVLRYI